MSDLLQTIEPFAELWAASLWRASWQGAIAIAIAWAIAHWCSFLSPRVVCWIWRLVCLKMLVALCWIQPLAIPLLPAKPVGRVILEIKPHDVPAAKPEFALSPTEPITRFVPQSGAPASGIAFVNLAVALWLTGALCRVVITGRQWISIRQLCSSAQPVTNILLQQMFFQVAKRLAVRGMPQLRVSPRADGPLLAGIWRPTIVLPECAEAAFDEAELRLTLAHELAHLKRRDLLWNWLPTIVSGVFFFHPLVWLMTRRWSEAQEAACDELLIQNQVAGPAEYGRLLLKLSARWPMESCSPLAAAGVLGAYRNLERRILAMAHVRPFSRAGLMAAACVAIVISTIGMVPWQLTAQEIKNEEDQKLLASWDKMTNEQAALATSKNLEAIMAAVHGYADAHDGKFPPIAVANPNIPEVKQLSGFVLLLPYLGEKPSHSSDEAWLRYQVALDPEVMRKAKEIYRTIDLTKAWDDPKNQEVARSVIPVFLAPKSAPIRDERGIALSHFAFIRGFSGNDNGVFDKVGLGVPDITDGTVKTLAVGQVRSELGPWIAAGPATARHVYPPEGSRGNLTFGSPFKQGWFAALASADPCFVDAERANGTGFQFIVQRNDRMPVQVEDYAYQLRPESEFKKFMLFLKKENPEK